MAARTNENSSKTLSNSRIYFFPMLENPCEVLLEHGPSLRWVGGLLPGGRGGGHVWPVVLPVTTAMSDLATWLLMFSAHH